jgi:hypothetical protein
MVRGKEVGRGARPADVTNHFFLVEWLLPDPLLDVGD